jgi:hypothetical protein
MNLASPRTPRTARSSLSPARPASQQSIDTTSTQVTFFLHSIRGSHLSDQAAVVCLNGITFLLYPRTVAPRVRYYESGFCAYLPPNEDIRFSVGVFTPDNDTTGFLHCFVRYNMSAPTEPIKQDVVLESPGNVYAINVSIYIAPSTRGSPEKPTRPNSQASRFSPQVKTSSRRSSSRLTKA